jgi:hypothetical protein
MLTHPRSTTSTVILGAEKQGPIVRHGPINEAMNAAEVKLIEGWGDIVRSWEKTR